jgi:hypothetical protein
MLCVQDLLDSAATETGLDELGSETFLEGLSRLVDSLNSEARLHDTGEQILALRLRTLLANRMRIEDTYRRFPSIDEEEIEGPLIILGLPRTGTTALSQLVACDPQIRSLRLWESSSPVPPPEAATQETDPRIEQVQRGLDMMYEVFPRMASLYFQTATGATECQDLLGMEFRTAHFDGMANVPSYTHWVTGCDMAPAYAYHRRTLRLLQWHCPPRPWHLKTPVHMLALDALSQCYPNAAFLWTHRDPVEVLGSVCSLVSYTRSWVSEHGDAEGLGAQQVKLWCEALRRAMSFRAQRGEGRFADIFFDELNAEPVATVARAYERLGLELSGAARRRMGRWSESNARGTHGSHKFELADFSLDAGEIRERFSFYTGQFGLLR